MLNLMYITNDPDVASIAQKAGVQRIFVDMESLHKGKRQGGMDTVQNAHTLEDARCVREVLTSSQLLVRVNPIHDPQPGYPGSKAEIDGAIAAGADIVMLPYFHTADEVARFVQLVDGRARTMPLLETDAAVRCVDDILAIEGIDEMFIGLNDLSLNRGQSFMFEPMVDGTVEWLSHKFDAAGIPWGFGGIASLGRGLLHSERIIAEHYRMGSQAAILSRSFCNAAQVEDLEAIDAIFANGMRAIRDYEGACDRRLAAGDTAFFERNMMAARSIVKEIAETQRKKEAKEAKKAKKKKKAAALSLSSPQPSYSALSLGAIAPAPALGEKAERAETSETGETAARVEEAEATQAIEGEKA